MDKELYDLMDWAAVEELVYSESRDPHAILCPKETGSGLLVQAFLPGAEHVEAVLSDGVSAEMEEEDENGFFACLIRGHKKAPYRIRAKMKDGTEIFSEDPWSFAPEIEEEDLKRFAAGNHTAIHEKLGAHVRTVDGVSVGTVTFTSAGTWSAVAGVYPTASGVTVGTVSKGPATVGPNVLSLS